MEKEFKVDLTPIRQGHTQKLSGCFAPSLLDIEEPELQFPSPITVKGEVYLSEEHIVMHFHAHTQALMPCAICNEMSTFDLKVSDFHQIEPLSSQEETFFDLAPILREALLLELPKRIECNQGKCPQRSELTPYLTQKNINTTHFPFASL